VNEPPDAAPNDSAREAMTQGFESSLTRALAAVVAIGIAGVTADNFSGPLLIASAGLITAYLVFQATFGLAAHKRDLLSRLGTFELLVRGRGNRLSESLAIEIHTWTAIPPTTIAITTSTRMKRSQRTRFPTCFFGGT
jgi:hypothetical protein